MTLEHDDPLTLSRSYQTFGEEPDHRLGNLQAEACLPFSLLFRFAFFLFSVRQQQHMSSTVLLAPRPDSLSRYAQGYTGGADMEKLLRLFATESFCTA
jgi:hypothetical protein